MSLLLPPLPPTFEAAVRDVRARGVQARVAAAQRLGAAADGERERALSGLGALLEDRDPRVRVAAVEALRELGGDGAPELLLPRIEDPDALVREHAVIALGTLRGERVESALRAATTSPHPEVRFQAVLSYAEACDDPLPAVVLSRLRDDDGRVRAHAARASRTLGTQAAAPLSSLQDDDDLRVRAEAALSLATLGEPANAHALLLALEQPDLVLEALDAIGTARPSALLEAVAAIAGSVLKPRMLKVAAARALLRMGDARGVNALREVLSGFRGSGRSAAVQAAGELAVVELLPELTALARRPRGADPVVLAEALRTLLPQAPAARPALEHLAQRQDKAGETARAALR